MSGIKKITVQNETAAVKNRSYLSAANEQRCNVSRLTRVFGIGYKHSIDVIATWIIGLSFLIAGFPHWSNAYYFLGSVYAYKLVEPGMGQMIAMGMPIVQLVLALCFLTCTFLDAAHLATLFLLTCFATVQTSAWLRGLDISCGCFGPGHDSPIGWFSLSLVYGLLILSLIRNGIFLTARSKEKPNDARGV